MIRSEWGFYGKSGGDSCSANKNLSKHKKMTSEWIRSHLFDAHRYFACLFLGATTLILEVAPQYFVCYS